MRQKILTLIVAAAAGAALFADSAYAGDPSPLVSVKDKESYGTGIMIIRSLMKQGGELNLDLVVQGMKDGLTGNNLLMSEAECKKVMAALQDELDQRQRQAANKSSSTNAATANAEANGSPAIQKDQTAPKQQDDQGGLLAEKGSAGAALAYGSTANNSSSSSAGAKPSSSGSVGNGSSAAPAAQDNQTQIAAQYGAPSGTFLSRRNQARLDMQSLKQEMRGKAMSSAPVVTEPVVTEPAGMAPAETEPAGAEPPVME